MVSGLFNGNGTGLLSGLLSGLPDFMATGFAVIRSGINLVVDIWNNAGNFLHKAIITISGGSTKNIFPIDAEGGFRLLNNNGQVVGAPSLQGGGSQIQAALAHNVSLVYLFHNASGSDAMYKSTVLSADLSSYPIDVMRNATVAWKKTGTGTANVKAPIAGRSATVTANNGIANVNLIAYVANSDGRTVGTGEARVLSIEMSFPVTVKLLADAKLRALPSSSGESEPLEKGQSVYIWGFYKNYVLVDAFKSGWQPISGFVEKSKVNIPDLDTRIATSLAPILYGSASLTNIDKTKELIAAAKRNGHEHAFDEPACCTDGVDERWGHSWSHADGTAFPKNSNQYADPFLIRYVVIPGNHSNVNNYAGDIAILKDHTTSKFVIAIIAEKGPNNSYRESSLSALWDLLGEERGRVNGSWVNFTGTNRFSVTYLPETRSIYAPGTWSSTSWNDKAKLFGWSRYNSFPVDHQASENVNSHDAYNPHCIPCANS